MSQIAIGRPVSGMSPAAMDGGAKHPRPRLVRQVLVPVDTCICCRVNKVDHSFPASFGHRMERIRICDECFTKVPLQRVAAIVFGVREAKMRGIRLYPVFEMAPDEPVGNQEVGV